MLTQLPKSYAYGQYRDDADIVAFFTSMNEETQAIFLWLVSVCYADYRQDPISGSLLDWVAQALYGMTRRVVTSSSKTSLSGEFANNVLAYDEIAGGLVVENTSTAQTLSDDLLRRSLTWNTYEGDGWTFSTPWLRRRLIRYMYAPNGFDVDTHPYWNLVSIQWIGNRTANVVLYIPEDGTVGNTLAKGLSSGYLRLPLGYSLNLSFES